jgi:hypothetical protein
MPVAPKAKSSLPLAVAKRTIAMIHTCLAEGFVPAGVTPPKGVRGAIAEAAHRLGDNRATIGARVASDGPCARLYGLRVDWKRWRQPKRPKLVDQEKPPVEQLQLRRMADQVKEARRAQASAERIAVTRESLRENVFALRAMPLEPPSWKPEPTAAKGKIGEALVLMLSDIHKGEVVDLKAMGGRNSYNKDIATARLRRYFQNVVKLGTAHWHGAPPSVIYLVLMGDMITGEIHPELLKTNDLFALRAAKAVAADIVAGLTLLLASFACPIHVVSVDGNHGRTTLKPESKGHAIDSFDTLVAWEIEAWVAGRGEKRIICSEPSASGDALINIFGWNCLFTHGDRIGSRGGQGFIGPAATIARGMQNVIKDFAADNTIVDFVFVGHFHTALELEQGFANGSVIGPTEYSRSGRMRSAPPTQWMLSVHRDHGIARRWKVFVGHPDEGSIMRSRVA